MCVWACRLCGVWHTLQAVTDQSACTALLFLQIFQSLPVVGLAVVQRLQILQELRVGEELSHIAHDVAMVGTLGVIEPFTMLGHLERRQLEFQDSMRTLVE